MFHKLFTLILCALNLQSVPKCILNSRIHFGQPLPIVVRNGKLLEPTDSNGNAELESGETLILSCEGSGNLYHRNAIHEQPTATVTCQGGDNFKNDEWLSAPAQFFYFRCGTPPPYKSQRTNRTCFENNPVVEVGYKVGNEFYPSYESCFNEIGCNVIYSKYTQKPYNAHFQTKIDRPFFISNNDYGSVPVESLYYSNALKQAVSKLVGAKIGQYFTSGQFLNRGHLAAKTDFVYAFGERATFHYINCAPQWYGFNGGNWNTLEVDLRDHIHSAGYNTIIYTGTFGMTQLLDENKTRVDIYLYKDRNNNPLIPVPQYYYKVVYEPDTKKGIAFVGINNPYYSLQEARQLFFCEDICRGNSRFTWLSWHPDNAYEGYTFCCTVSDFRATVPHLPQFEVDSLLT